MKQKRTVIVLAGLLLACITFYIHFYARAEGPKSDSMAYLRSLELITGSVEEGHFLLKDSKNTVWEVTRPAARSGSDHTPDGSLYLHDFAATKTFVTIASLPPPLFILGHWNDTLFQTDSHFMVNGSADVSVGKDAFADDATTNTLLMKASAGEPGAVSDTAQVYFWDHGLWVRIGNNAATKIAP